MSCSQQITSVSITAYSFAASPIAWSEYWYAKKGEIYPDVAASRRKEIEGALDFFRIDTKAAYAPDTGPGCGALGIGWIHPNIIAHRMTDHEAKILAITIRHFLVHAHETIGWLQGQH